MEHRLRVFHAPRFQPSYSTQILCGPRSPCLRHRVHTEANTTDEFPSPDVKSIRNEAGCYSHLLSAPCSTSCSSKEPLCRGLVEWSRQTYRGPDSSAQDP